MNELPKEIRYKLTDKKGNDFYLTVSRMDLVDWDKLFSTHFPNASETDNYNFRYGKSLVTLTLQKLARDKQIGLYAREKEIAEFFDTTWIDDTDRLDSFILLFSNNVANEAPGTYHIITDVDKNGQVFTRVMNPERILYAVQRKPEDTDGEMEN